MRILPRITSLAAALFIAALSAGAASAAVLIEIDKAAQHMTVSVDGIERYSWPVSTGRAGRETPEGEFKPFRLEEDHYSKEWDDAPMPHSIFFTRQGHAIHGSYDVKKLGTPASAGCVRLAPANAATLFRLVKEQGLAHVSVVIGGEEPTMSVSRRPARRSAGAPLPVTPQARVWPDEAGEREALDNYAARMRQRYYQSAPRDPYDAPPVRRWYGARSYYYGWE